jgi:hypothetical protein
MSLIRRLVRALCTLAIFVAGSLAVFSMAIASFIATGMLSTGEPMYVGTSTPTLGQAILHAALCAIVTAGLAYVRGKSTRAEKRRPQL